MNVYLYRDWDKYFVYYELESGRDIWIEQNATTPAGALFNYMKAVYKEDELRVSNIDITLGHRESVQINDWVNIWIDLANFDDLINLN
jgi:hypothetical protein